MPKRYECGCAVIDDKGFVAGHDVVHERIKSPPVYLVPFHELQMLSTQRGILRKRLVHRVGVNADRVNTVGFVELRNKTRDQALAHAAFPLQAEVYASGAFGILGLVIDQRVSYQ